MYSPKSKSKKGVLSKMWERCKSFSGSIGRKGSLATTQNALKTNSAKSSPCGFLMESLDQDEERKKRSKKVVPEGCLSIYVGPEKERFVIKTEFLNHHLFKILLEEAESEYGYDNKGPLMLPCEVDHFINVLMEMDDEEIGKQKGCNFVARSQYSSYHFLTTPSRWSVDVAI